MKTINEQVQESFIVRSIDLLQYSEGLSKRAVKLMTDTEEDLAKLVLYHATKLQGVPVASAAFRKQIKILENGVRVLRSSAWSTIGKLLNKELSEVVVDEGKFVSRLLRTHLPALNIKNPSGNLLVRNMLSTPMNGATLAQQLIYAENADVKRIVTAATRSLAVNRSNAVTAMRAVVGSRAQRYKDGVSRAAWNDGDTLSYTATNNAQTSARGTVAKANEFIITEEYFVATLDGGTTPLCIANDTLVFKLNEGPHPPLHYRCRSLRLPFISPQSMSERAYDPSTEKTLIKEFVSGIPGLKNLRNRDALPWGMKIQYDKWARARRRELIGHVPDKTSYETFLRGRSNDFQDEKMGATRAALFRTGKYSIDKFVDAKGGWITIEELKRRGML